MCRLLHRLTAWYLPVILLGALLPLAACGSGNTPSAATPTTVSTTTANTPTAGTHSATPTLPAPTQAPKATPAAGSSPTVMIITNSDGSFGFSPTTLTVKPGTTVMWKNISSAPHTVTSDDGTSFDSGTIVVGASYQFKFKTAGTFSYHCNYHPYMKATINSY
jgi:plastocyanin